RIERVLDGPGGSALTFFEVATVAAFIAFAEERVQVAVVECGLGGRFDATTTCEPVVTVVTRIGLEHAEVLGDTLERIAFEKAAIARKGVPLVAGPLDPGPRAVVEETAAGAGAPLVIWN